MIDANDWKHLRLDATDTVITETTLMTTSIMSGVRVIRLTVTDKPGT